MFRRATACVIVLCLSAALARTFAATGQAQQQQQPPGGPGGGECTPEADPVPYFGLFPSAGFGYFFGYDGKLVDTPLERSGAGKDTKR